MSAIQHCSPEGSMVCFDYLTEQLESFNPSEPLKFWITQGELKDLLSSYGFVINEHLDSADMTQQYLTLQDGTVAAMNMPLFCLVKAVTSAS